MTFLYRKEQKALEAKVGGETLVLAVPAAHDDVHGVLGVTRFRIYFAHKKRLGTKVMELHRGDIAAMKRIKERYGAILFRTKKGQSIRFDMLESGALSKVATALAPPAKTKSLPKPVPKAPAPDPLAHRQTDAHKAKLRDMLERGMITKDEYEWHLAK